MIHKAILLLFYIHAVHANFLFRGKGHHDDSDEAEAGDVQSVLLGPPHVEVNKVVEAVSNYMWHNETSNFKDDPPKRFIIAGSYAAAAKAYELNPDLVLPYNDIDVFVQTKHRCNVRIKRVWYLNGLIPHREDISVNFVHLCQLDLDDLVEGFDINAIMIGFQVDPVYDRKLHRVVPSVHWHWDKAFDTFVNTKTMEVIREGQGQYAGSFIRLLHKAQQSKGKYKIWDQEKLKTTVHGSTFTPRYLKKLEKLEEPYKSEVFSRFDVWEVRRKLYMLVMKEMLPPLPDPKTIVQRNLAMVEYNEPTPQPTDAPTPQPTHPPTPPPTNMPTPPQIKIPPNAPFAVPEGTFLISSTDSGLYLTVHEHCTWQADVTVEPLIRANTRQLFKHGSSNSIESVYCPGLVLDIDAWQCDPGLIIIWPQTGGNNQAFDASRVETHSDNKVAALVDRHCQYYLTAPAGGEDASAGQEVTVKPKGEVVGGMIPAVQQWHFEGDFQG